MEHYHEIRPGECFASVAKLYKFENAEVLYDHPRNAELKRLRPNRHVLYPGDRVFIPVTEIKEVDAATEQLHVFRLSASSVYLRLIAQDVAGAPCRRKKYALRIGEELRHGLTDSSGLIKERIRADAREAELTVWFNDTDENQFYKWNLNVGHLDPVDEISGVQARLNNLGYFCGAVDGQIRSEATARIREFQRAHQLPETGEINDAVRAKLMELHRC